MNRFVEFVSPNGKDRVLINAPLVLTVTAVREDAPVRHKAFFGFELTPWPNESHYNGPAAAVQLIGQKNCDYVRGDAAEVAKRLEVKE